MEAIYLPELNEEQNEYKLPSDELNHVKVMRLNVGDKLLAINGNGITAVCAIKSITKKEAIVEIMEYFFNQGENNFDISVAIGILDNKERMEFALEKVVELGAVAFYPLITEFTQRKIINVERFVQKAIAATKQCKRSKLIKIFEAQKFSEFINNISIFQTIILADENGEKNIPTNANHICILVGPEGGFSSKEINIIKSLPNTISLNLGNRRLRAETALITAISKFI